MVLLRQSLVESYDNLMEIIYNSKYGMANIKRCQILPQRGSDIFKDKF